MAHKIRDEFCRIHPTLERIDTNELIAILDSTTDRWLPQLFVADILSRHEDFNSTLMVPLLRAAIANPDPSSNRDFLTPCLKSFGSEKVVNWLARSFVDAPLLTRIGIANLVYHLRYEPVDFNELRRRRAKGIATEAWVESHAIDSSPLTDLIVKAASSTDNLIELYFYRQALSDMPELLKGVPRDAMELERAIAGQPQYERLLYDDLNWTRIADNPDRG